MFESGLRPGGWAVVLAGDDAGEIQELRDVLQWDPAKVLFVDTKPEGLRRVLRYWPEANVFHGDITEALERCGPIGFANMDFMGPPTSTVRESLRTIGEKLGPGGVVSYTFNRGRENKWNRDFWDGVIAKARDHSKKMGSTLRTLDEERFVGYELVMREQLSLPYLYRIQTTRYRNRWAGGMCMGTMAMQYLPAFLQTHQWRQLLRTEDEEKNTNLRRAESSKRNTNGYPA